MPGGMFDNELKINSQGCLSPAGPLKLDRGEKALRLDVWVFQHDNAACVAVLHEFKKKNRWEAHPDPVDDHTGGKFQPGPATAMALVVSKTGRKTEVYQWTQGVLLVAGPKGSRKKKR